MSAVEQNKQRMYSLAKKIIGGDYKGFSGKLIKNIVNVGIGGSNLGPVFVNEALKFYSNDINLHFISNIEGDHLFEVLKSLDLESTIFIIASKTFTTQETITNAEIIKDWFLQKMPENAFGKHFFAVTSKINKAKAFEILDENIFHIADWTGGRFSLWGPVGIAICISIGPNNFESLLNGAYSMDRHFRNTEFKKNIPVILALISVWYNNFWGADSEAIIPYSEYLKYFPSYLQQASMESNGKSTDRNSQKVNYQTGGILWGATGTNAQHSFFQLLHQGTRLIPCDFIAFQKPHSKDLEQHKILIANFLAQTNALMSGQKKEGAHKYIEGNKPSNSLFINSLTPYNLGALIAMYENKIFTVGSILNIFSFDQWGVELGKSIAKGILDGDSDSLDISTKNLLTKYNKEK